MPSSKRYKRHKTKTTKKINKVDLTILILNILLALALLLSYLAPDTDPRAYSIIALFGFIFLILLAINVLFIIYWSVRKKYYVFISIVCVLLGYKNVSISFGFRGKNQPSEQKPQNTFRVMAYNVGNFTGIDKYENTPIQNNVFEIISENKPDILSIEEYKSTHDERGRTADSIKKRMQALNYYFKPYKITSQIDSIGYAIFSRYPIIHADTIAAPHLLDLHAIYADINYQGKTIRVYSIHLAAVSIQGSQKRKYTNGSELFSGGSFIESKLSSAFVFRSYQVDRIKNHMDKCPYPYIVAGDFNDTPVSFAVNTIGAGLKNAFREQGSGLVTTYYSRYPLQIDNILTSPQFDILNYEAVDKKVSDHKPVISDLKLN